MSKTKRLIQSYGRYIAVPWQKVAPPQRVIFCVYNAEDELQVRAKITEFEIVTRQANHGWAIFDLTDTFAKWLGSHRYKKSYFKNPDLISTVLSHYLLFIKKEFEIFLQNLQSTENTVVALKGVGSLFGFLKIKDLAETLAPLIDGRILFFFPGEIRENNNYRLLDAYDGWNYLAVPITADRELQ